MKTAWIWNEKNTQQALRTDRALLYAAAVRKHTSWQWTIVADSTPLPTTPFRVRGRNQKQSFKNSSVFHATIRDKPRQQHYHLPAPHPAVMAANSPSPVLNRLATM